MKRREFITLIGGAAASWPLAARAQKALPRIGWLVYGDAQLGPIDRSLKEALAQAGLVDGRNIEIIFRYANGISDRLAQLAAELVAQNPDLLLAIGGDVIKPLFEASKGSIPIVGGVSDSPMRAGIAMSLARPGKNFTGITYLTDEMAAKRIELLKEVAPNARRVAVIFNPQHFDDEVTFVLVVRRTPCHFVRELLSLTQCQPSPFVLRFKNVGEMVWRVNADRPTKETPPPNGT